ncbi:MAG: chemotaxis protein CheW [Nitrospira sp.]|nr:purine-binding chemotaxis protein CheW [Nitrospira sp.]
MMNSLQEFPVLLSDGEPEQRKTSSYWKVCVITLGDERFAIDLRQVREVFKLASVTPVPGMPDHVVGVANLRGVIVPLADVRAFLGLPLADTYHYALVVWHGLQQVGVVIDNVPEIRTIHADDLVAPSAHHRTQGASLISSFFKTDARLTGLFEVSRLLAMVEGE